MMIALAILGMGLLVIGAALPIGIRYTRASVNKATGEAAAEYALDTIEQNVCLRRSILDLSNMPPTLDREVGLFQPRAGTTQVFGGRTYYAGQFIPDYEPVIKVRPLYVRSINAAGGANYGQQEPNPQVPSEAIVRNLFLRIWGWPGFDTNPNECDPDSSNLLVATPGPWMRWALPSVATVYPPISSDVQFEPVSYFSSPYTARIVTAPPNGSETLKTLDRRIVWTAFYRRVSYEQPGSDPALYEFIVVAMRVPSGGFRFPVQLASDGGAADDGERGALGGDEGAVAAGSNGNLGPNHGYSSGSAGVSSSGTGGGAGGQGGGDFNAIGGASGDETSAPTPWLVTFDTNGLPAPPRGFDQTTGYPLGDDSLPITMGSPNAPATLTFHCLSRRSGLLPVGSIFIPARNDYRPYRVSLPQWRVGLGPPAPTALPIYEVTERPDDTTIIVKFNGYYPMQGTPGLTQPSTPAAALWPVWVIPPAFEEYENGAPVPPDQCQIVAVARRYIRLREVP